jgi:WD40 repeat protein
MHLKGHGEAVSFLAFNQDDTKLLTCSNDKTLRIWNVATGRCEARLVHHTDAVTACAWMKDGRIISGSLDKHIHVWVRLVRLRP